MRSGTRKVTAYTAISRPLTMVLASGAKREQAMASTANAVAANITQAIGDVGITMKRLEGGRQLSSAASRVQRSSRAPISLK